MVQKLRSLENIASVDYDPDKKTVFYAQDQNTQNEILQSEGKIENQLNFLNSNHKLGRMTVAFQRLYKSGEYVRTTGGVWFQTSHSTGREYPEWVPLLNDLLSYSRRISEMYNAVNELITLISPDHIKSGSGDWELYLDILGPQNQTMGYIYAYLEKGYDTHFEIWWDEEYITAPVQTRVAKVKLTNTGSTGVPNLLMTSDVVIYAN